MPITENTISQLANQLKLLKNNVAIAQATFDKSLTLDTASVGVSVDGRVKQVKSEFFDKDVIQWITYDQDGNFVMADETLNITDLFPSTSPSRLASLGYIASYINDKYAALQDAKAALQAFLDAN